MRLSSAGLPIFCCRSAQPPGRTCSFARCWRSSCSERHRSLRTTPIIAKVRACGSPLSSFRFPCLRRRARRCSPPASRSTASSSRRGPNRLRLRRKLQGSSKRLPARGARSNGCVPSRPPRRRYRGSRSSDHRRRHAAPTGLGLRRRAPPAARGRTEPVSSLLAGLAVMGRRPPLLAIADQGSTDELVKVRILLDSTLPVIRARTAKLSTQLSEGKRLEQAAASARAELIGSRQNLLERRQQFASLEQKALGFAGQVRQPRAERWRRCSCRRRTGREPPGLRSQQPCRSGHGCRAGGNGCCPAAPRPRRRLNARGPVRLQPSRVCRRLRRPRERSTGAACRRAASLCRRPAAHRSRRLLRVRSAFPDPSVTMTAS